MAPATPMPTFPDVERLDVSSSAVMVPLLLPFPGGGGGGVVAAAAGAVVPVEEDVIDVVAAAWTTNTDASASHTAHT